MKAVCDKYGALLILDEVMCGMSRVGYSHAWMDEGVVPDIETLGKGLGGGYAPAAAMLVGPKVVNVLDKGTGSFSHGQTYQGHPLACAAAEAVMRYIEEHSLLADVRRYGKTILEEKLKSKLSSYPHVGNVRGKGFFWGVCRLAVPLAVLMLTFLD